MSYNTFGQLFRFTTFGESHGPSIGCIVDGTPPGINLNEQDIQYLLDKRRPGASKVTTQRKEPDKIKILSGVFEGKTTGTPIGLVIENIDTRSKDYSEIKAKYRPGHADYTYTEKYKIRDFRGGGRSSARETAMRVAAGGIARKILGKDIIIRGALIQMGELIADRNKWDWEEVENNPFFCPDASVVPELEQYINSIRKMGSSVGAIIEVIASGVPVGWGAPIYGKLDQDIASAMMSINAVKGVEIGVGMKAGTMTGRQNADEMLMDGDTVSFNSNNSGGILGGISSGQDIVCRFAVKPTSSISLQQKTVTLDKKNTTISTKGRHDPCVGIRAVPVGEAMMACVLADHMLRHRAQCA